MTTTVKRILATVAVTTAALATAGAVAPEAQAKRYGIDNGAYTWIQNSSIAGYRFHVTGVATVRGNVMTLRPRGKQAAPSRFRIVPTRNGGYTDPGFGMRFAFAKKSRGSYSGTEYTFGIRTGNVRLLPR